MREGAEDDVSAEQLTCFVISPIGEDGSKIRERADDVIEFIIEPAAKEHGFTVERADGISEPGRITRQIVERLISATVVVADLSGSNPNVFYELAIRHALQKWAVHLYEEISEVPFDVQDYRAIRIGTGARSASEARAQLSRALTHVKERPNEQVKTPFTEGIDLQITTAAVAGGNASIEQRLLAEMSELRDEVRGLRPVQARAPSRAPNVYNTSLSELISTMEEFPELDWAFEEIDDDGDAVWFGSGEVASFATYLSREGLNEVSDYPLGTPLSREFHRMIRRRDS